MCNTPGFSGKKPVIEQPWVETFQRSLTEIIGNFSKLFDNGRTPMETLLSGKLIWDEKNLNQI